MAPARRQETAEQHVRSVLDGSRSGIARAITLVESTRPDHRPVAQQMWATVMRALEAVGAMPKRKAS